MSGSPEVFTIRGGQFATDVRLDRIRQVDLRDLNFPAVGPEGVINHDADLVSMLWALDVFNDQGKEGACVGFGWGHEAAAEPVALPGVDAVFSRERIYWLAQKDDEYKGGAYPGADPQSEGSSVRAGAQVLVAFGYITGFRWALTLKDICLVLGHDGPVVIGVDWYGNMFEPDADGYLRPTGNIEGGHCTLLIGVEIVLLDPNTAPTWENVDMVQSYVIVHNSWGPAWGENGRAKIALIDLAKLLPGGDFCVPIGRKLPELQTT